MKTLPRLRRCVAVLGLLALARLSLAAPDPAPAAAPAAPARPTKDANGNALRYAATGHVSNYDESKVGTYTLPDPLVLLERETRARCRYLAQPAPAGDPRAL